MRQVVVIGAGVVGTAVAYRLARAGAATTLVEQGEIGGGTSGATFSVNITSRKTPREYYDFSFDGIAEHHRLAREVGVHGTWMNPIACYEWATTDHDRALIRERVQRLQDWGYPVRWVKGTRLQAAEPHLALDRFPADEVALFPNEVWYDAPTMAAVLATAAQEQGATVHTRQQATGVRRRDDERVVVSTQDGNEIVADVVVNCAGPAAAHVAQLAGATLPLLRVPGLVAATTPMETVPVSSLVLAPTADIRPTVGNRVFLHSFTVDAGLAANPDSLDEHAATLLERVRSVLPVLNDVALEQPRLGIRPVPADGLPIVGWLADGPGMYVLASHSAVHLAPILSSLAATEILGGQPVPQLAAYRPDRRSLLDPATSAVDESTREMSRLFARTAST